MASQAWSLIHGRVWWNCCLDRCCVCRSKHNPNRPEHAHAILFEVAGYLVHDHDEDTLRDAAPARTWRYIREVYEAVQEAKED